jgi:hypothetical protein
VLIQDLAGGALGLSGSSAATLDGSKIIADYGTLDCVAQAATQTLESASLTIKNAFLGGEGGSTITANGVRALGSGPLVVAHSRIDGFNAHGIVAGPNMTSITVSGGSELEGDRTALDAHSATRASIIIEDAKVTNDANGVIVPSLKMRRSAVTQNTTGNGIVITGPHADLGTAFDPGNNVITDNGTGGLGTGVQFDPSVTSGTIDAAGDVWNPLQQGADAFGLYPSITVHGGQSLALGSNFKLPNGGQSITLGPFIGRLHLTSAVVHARADKLARLILSWTHPQSWRQLRSIELRLYEDAKAVGRVIILPTGDRIEATGAVALVTSANHLHHHGKTVTARLGLRFARTLAGRTLRVAVAATDQHSHRQVVNHAGQIRVTR